MNFKSNNIKNFQQVHLNIKIPTFCDEESKNPKNI